jgi:hypothetical protein
LKASPDLRARGPLPTRYSIFAEAFFLIPSRFRPPRRMKPGKARHLPRSKQHFHGFVGHQAASMTAIVSGRTRSPHQKLCTRSRHHSLLKII